MSEIIKLVPFEESRGPSLVSVCASELPPESIEWVWPGRLAKGKHACFAGEPGVGKSQLTMWITAAITMGGKWPCNEGRAPQGSVLILSAEDGAADTIVPRLHAAGADLGRVQIVQAVRDGKLRRTFDLQRDLALLEEEVERIGDVLLIIIDPVSSYLGKTDSHRNAEVRGVLEPIGEFAGRMRLAVLSVTHFSKSGANASSKALHRFIGSIAFVGAPRIAQIVVRDEQTNRCLLLHAKNNLAPPPQGLSYSIEETIVGPVGKAITAPYVVWDQEPVSVTADEALSADSGKSDRGASEEAEAFLKELLGDGPFSAKQVKTDSEAAGLSWPTIRRAKARLGIKASKARGVDYGGWMWALPARCSISPSEPLEPLEHLDGFPPFLGAQQVQGAQGAQDAHQCELGTLAAVERLGPSSCSPSDLPDIPAFLDRRSGHAL